MERSRVAGVRGVLFTDMVGSSQLRSELGDDRADDLRRDHDEILSAVVAAHDGNVLRSTGDGMKADFASASAAVAAAIDMQRAVERYGRGVDAVAPFQIRVGLSVGEVTVEDDDIHGVAVIEGARLEAMAGPGEILATDLVQRLGQRRVGAEFEDAGSHTLKGLDQPVAVLRVVDTGADDGTRPVPKALALDRRFPMVGRADDFDAALRCWNGVRAGAAATVLVAGPAGIGKSRFVAQVADRAHADGALVLAGGCDSDLAVPYQPFAEAFGDGAVADDELAAAVETGAGPLGPLFPARRTGRFEDAGPAARYEVFEEVVALVDRLAHDQPLVLVLEDLQWATQPTVQLLRHLVRHAPHARVLLLASYRVDDVDASHPLHDFLAETHTATTVTRVELGALRLPDVAELVAAGAPAAPAENVADFARRVCEESGGSPFFVCELLHHLSATGELARLVSHGGGSELPIPDSVRDVVGQRLGRLPEGAGELLSAAAVIGLTFDLELLANLVAQAPEQVLGALEAVERVALVSEVDVGRFSFGHAIVRATLLESMSATRRALAHRRVAEAIELLQRSDHDQLAHHWLLAGVEDKANVSLEMAARRDLEALAYESAAERYQAVLDYHRRSRGDPAATARAWLGLGLARRAMGQVDYLGAIEEAGRLGRKLHDVDVVADAAIASIWPGTFFVTAGHTQTSLVELAEDALELIDDTDPRRVRILSTLAAHLTFDVDRARRAALLGEALALARDLGDPELIGGVLVAEYLAMWDPTTAGRRADIAREVARMARASGDIDLEFFGGFFASIGAAERCDVAEARRRLEMLAGPVTASRNFYFGFLAERLLTSLDVLAGESGVQARIDALAERYAGTHADTSGTWSAQTGGVAYQAGALGDLAGTLRTMIEESEISSNWKPALGIALLAKGDRAGAMAVLDEFEEPPLDYFWLTTMQILADLAVGLDRQDLLPGFFAKLSPFRDQLGITASGSLCLGIVATTLGQMAVAMGDHEVAHELLDDAVRRADAMGAPFESVKTRRLLATALLGAGGPPDEIAKIVDVATDVAKRHGFRGERVLLEGLPVPGVIS